MNCIYTFYVLSPGFVFDFIYRCDYREESRQSLDHDEMNAFVTNVGIYKFQNRFYE